MRFKRLYLQGYKTFANKTEFLFDDGITAIVGPNGSGKSNIADAVRWVLGEQSYSELRGKRGTDMIFSGSQNRPRAGMAHASLVLDNSDGWLGIDYSEVEVSRRIYRDGQSEYYLNGQKVRLKDITNLLATSGLAGRTYTMIGQGLVDRALSLRADERRALFEEAAGISHYKDRRAETLRRLQETQRNLERVHDILEEIRPRLRSLKRQAERAENYEQVHRDLHELLRVWYGYQWEASRTALRARRAATGSAESAWRASRQRLARQQEQIDALRRQLNQIQQTLHAREAERDDLRDQFEQARREAAILRERRSALAAQQAELAREIPDLDAQRATAQADLAQATAELDAARQTLAAERQQLATFESSYQTQQVEIRRWRTTVQELTDGERAAQTRLAQTEGQLAQLRERQQERQTAAVDPDEVAQVQARLAELTTTLADLEARRATLRGEQAARHAERQTIIRELKRLRQDSAETERRLTQLAQQVAKAETRVDMLDQLRHKPPALSGNAAVVRTFATDLTIPDAYQVAVEAALADRVGTLLAADEDALWHIVRHNARRPVLVAAVGRLVAPPALPLPAADGVVGWANTLVDCPPDAHALRDYLLGHVLVMRDGRAALAVARDLPPSARVVTVDGVLFYGGGLVETGRGHGQNALLQRERDWRAAQEQLAGLQRDSAELRAAQSPVEADIAARQQQVDVLTDTERRLAVQEQTVARQIADAQRQLDRARQQADFYERQISARDSDIARLATRIEEVEASLTPHRETLARITADLTAARATLQALPVAEMAQQRSQLQQSLQAAQTIVAGRQAVVDSRRATLGQIESRLQRQGARRSELEAQLAAIDLPGTEQRLQTVQARMDELGETLAPLRAQRATLLERSTDLETTLAQEQKSALDLETAYTEARVALSQQQNQLDGLKERIKADLGLVALAYDEDETVQTPLPMADVVEQLPQVDALPDGIEESITRRRGQLQRMGAVNPDAPQEFEETQARHDFLEQQLEDLATTEKQLRSVIGELDELTSREFARTVEAVNGIFNTMFTRLFGGGSAELILTDPDDLTISGVDIMARLPRRRPQGLALLSGGERSLTAAALIFALLTVAPPPFCVMDEVDAALDEANVNRFRDVLKELSEAIQFIVITHNRGTVQSAETIYGVSMQPDGTSQVISIKADDYVSAGPAA